MQGADWMWTVRRPVAEEMAPWILADDRVLAAAAVQVAVWALVLTVELGTLARPS